VTDAYQPIERRLGITRACLEVLAEFRNPAAIITKSHLVTRDADLLGELARHRAARVILSVTSLDAELARKLEPRAASPARRLDAIRRLSGAGVPTAVMVGPVIPGLTDHELPAILEAAAQAGAATASFVVLRLPFGVKDLFADWLERNYPNRKEKVLSRVRDVRSGKLNDPRFRSRMRGEGPYAEQIRSMFTIAARRYGLDRRLDPLTTSAFRRPAAGGQRDLFDVGMAPRAGGPELP
jgi:DNA repair photolyase